MNPNTGYVQPSKESKFGLSRQLVLIAGGLLAAVVIAIVLLLSSSGKSVDAQVQHLVLRMDSLQALLTDKKTISQLKSQELADIASGFSLTLTTDSNDLVTALATNYPTKMDEKIVAAETDTLTAEAIESAYLENKLDAKYRDILLKKITSIRALIVEIYGLTKKQALKETLTEIDEHMHSTSEQLEKLKL